jgi:phage terminase large subunit GpA-like protein
VLNPFEAGWSDGFKPDAILSMCEWADQHIVLSGVDSSEPGPYRTSRTPYVREIAECLSPSSPIELIVWEASSQVAKTRLLLNWIAYIIAVAPGPTLFVEPTVELAKRISKQRVATMIESSDILRQRISPARERDSGNTLLEKEFTGGILIMAGANSAVGLRSMPARNIGLDEVDGYPADADGEGDPVALAIERASTFVRRKIFLCSTPTIKGLSRIDTAYLATDQRRYFVPCPHCGYMDFLRWERISWPDNEPEKAMLRCVACAVLIEERFKTQMFERGEWRATAVGTPKSRGYHISQLYSPIGLGKTWSELAVKWIAAQREPLVLKTFINTVLGEAWEEKGDAFDASDLKTRLENYQAEVPHGVGLLTASVDVQGDRLEYVVKGWGDGEESWLIANGVVPGDPTKPAPWFELDKLLLEQFTHESGRKVAIAMVAVDSGGHATDQVYTFTKSRSGANARRVGGLTQHVYPIKGVGGGGKEILGRPSTNNRRKVRLWPIGVDAAKDTVFSRMHIADRGPGYMHLPLWCDDEYLAQLTSEKAIRKYKKGIGAVREYVKLRERNEGLDLEVYALAALYMLGRVAKQRLKAYAEALSRPLEGPDRPQPDPAGPTPAPAVKLNQPSRGYLGGFGGGKNWTNRWRR